ncbi:CTP:phosphocholine cytidylyltransferase [Dyadobacter koreensis]|uniref:CTP:phosphocholine cytidylyltransferase n=1 Tax=Dyadobacter koreensis TaxID=408657 RepID=A0A1H7AYZ3_9BACT|nr:phosphocholine cytidylyltransferase family protein [Dyadobacter koreensis]SEJ69824.1 CTP:phosphocholine cytidylyltransferase [Dyadobacter koreensis]
MNAVILAAGCGSRLNPLTLQYPKPLVNINGTTIVERQIEFLNNIGVDDIYIVVGYMAEQFSFLEHRYNVKLIINPEYKSRSNFYSLYLCAKILSDTWIFEGDVFFTRNFLSCELPTSFFFVGPKRYLQGDGRFVIDQNNKVAEIIPMEWTSEPIENKQNILVPAGVSYWTRDSMKILVDAMKLAEDSGRALSFRSWDYIVIENLTNVELSAKVISERDWFEIDTLFDYKLALEFQLDK